MLKEFDFTFEDGEKDIIFIREARKKHAKKLQQIQQIIKTHQDLNKKFTIKQLEDHTKYVSDAQDKQMAQQISKRFINFLDSLKSPFVANKNIEQSIQNIIDVPGIKNYQKQIVQALVFQLTAYQRKLDHEDRDIIHKVQSIKKYYEIIGHDRQQIVKSIKPIMARDAILSKCFSMLQAPYESNIMRIIFTKLSTKVRKSTLLSSQYQQQQINYLLQDIQIQFKKNKQFFENLFKLKTVQYQYTIKYLYKYLVTNNYIELLSLYKDKVSIEKLYKLFQIMLNLEVNIKSILTKEDSNVISNHQYFLGVLFEKQHSLFLELFEYEKQQKIMNTKILDNLDFSKEIGSLLQQLNNNNEAFNRLLSDNYYKYIDAPSKVKTEIDKTYSQFVFQSINYFKTNIPAIMQQKKSVNRQVKFNALEQSKMIQKGYEENKIIQQIKKDHKHISDAINAFKLKNKQMFQTLSNEEYEQLQKKIKLQQKDQQIQKYLDDLYKFKHTKIQKQMFLKRMRLFFFKYIEKQDISRVNANKLLNIFDSYLKSWFQNKSQIIKNIIKAGNGTSQQKELMFLDKQERQILFKFKARQ